MVLKLKNMLVLWLKGICVGGSMMVPGVSGGSMAMVFCVYDRLIDAVANFLKNKLKNLIFLAVFAFGGIIGVVILSRPISYLLTAYPVPTSFFFFGAVIGGIPIIFKQGEIKLKPINIVPLLVGALCVLLITLIPNNIMNDSIWSTLLSGFFGSLALVLPGISVSFVLLVFGAYDNLLAAVNSFDLSFLVPFALSMLVGILACTKLIDYCFKRFKQVSFLIVLGFVLGSLVELFPGVPTGLDILLSIITLVVGFYFIFLLSKCTDNV